MMTRALGFRLLLLALSCSLSLFFDRLISRDFLTRRYSGEYDAPYMLEKAFPGIPSPSLSSFIVYPRGALATFPSVPEVARSRDRLASPVPPNNSWVSCRLQTGIGSYFRRTQCFYLGSSGRMRERECEGVEGLRLRSIQPRERRVSRLRARHRDPSNKRAHVASPFCAFISVSAQPTRSRYELPTG